MPAASTVRSPLNIESLLCERVRSIDASGIRKVFDLGSRMRDPINLSIGQPDFPVPEALKAAAIRAIQTDRNGYSVTQGVPELHAAIWQRLESTIGWSHSSELDLLVTSGTSGALLLAALAMLGPGDEIVFPDPWFVLYPQMARICGARGVPCDTYPDFRMTAARVSPLLTRRTKIVLSCSPSNPCGTVLTQGESDELAALCAQRGVLLISDEIYDGFTFAEAQDHGGCPTPTRSSRDVLLVRGFGKNYGCTGWRLGYAAGPTALIQQMAKLQQYTFVCAPTPLQLAAVESFGVDLTDTVQRYQRRRDMVLEAFRPVTNVTVPQGAFYAFVEVPRALGVTAAQFVERAIAQRVLIIPGGVFSSRDTHFRLSFAAPEAKLAEGLEILVRLMKSA